MAFDAEPDFTRFTPHLLSPAIGAELLGADLTNPDDTLISEVRAALLKYQVVFFRDQHDLTRQQHIDFARAFGELEIHPATPKDQPNPEVLRIAHGPNSKGQENNWHSDVTWRAEPSLGSILRAIELPKIGGDTLFSNMVMAYEDLSEELKERLCNMTAIHDIARVFAKRLGKDPTSLHERFPPQEHPVIRTHPETDARVLYVNIAFTDHIVGMDRAESDALLQYLYHRAWLPEYQCRFRWAPGSLAFWDNRACQHYAASDYFPNIRIMERVTIAGDRPYFTANA
ncbi:TauD/TfdA family dioxygenase [Hyphomonas sp. FCG-A18]|uniref:TauD/TfdA dioxygenase family protein n=1 Tax=Hyphomonas sp. FCG-A18 TaxID=3080019 RepID=UPI002B280852|nr:TauD/TfdA family dioxygenase [Hyphomonas sp. FCG-A18]